MKGEDLRRRRYDQGDSLREGGLAQPENILSPIRAYGLKSL